MPDLSIAASVIATTGTLLGALGAFGGIALTHRFTVRREEAQFNRQRKDQRMEARRQAHLDLLGTTTELRAAIETTGLGHWPDMNVRLATIQQRAVSAGLYASRVALLSPDTADVAFKLASAASRLAATTAQYTNMARNQNDQFLAGQITRPIDLTEFDGHIERFARAAAQDSREVTALPVVNPLPTDQGA
ncbi:MAG: hypothetical protein H0V41_02390 [Pseudonocardiales bacterium]|nr:hypothetical protein [Pseudonocardiales bacterium]